ncbi:MAG: tetratricopeptide repeat protein, partial [Thermodesulfobacteriota bacterium]
MISAKTIFSALLISIFCLSFISNNVSSQEKAGQLFEKALYLEEAQGDLQKAIDLYQQIVKQFPKDREVAAKSQLHIGLCYEKLGRDEAQKAYQRVIEEFADQHAVVAEARIRLSALEQPAIAANRSGMVVRKVWAGPELDLINALSPDGRHLSYVDWETGDLAVRDLVTGEKGRLTNKGSWAESPEFALYSIMSPDGKQVAYAWSNKDGVFELRIIGFDGSEPSILYRNEEVEYIQPTAWSPDGKQILSLQRRKDRANQIVLVLVADGSMRLLKTLDWRYPGMMSFSPDGRYIAYDVSTKEDPPERDIFLPATDGSREIRIVEHPANDFILGWAPEGKRILFASDRTGNIGAWVIQIADGKPQGPPELVKPDIGQVFPMGFSQNGSFYYILLLGMNDVYIADIDPITGKVLSSPTKVTQHFEGSNTGPDWSRDGQYLAYLRGPVPSVGRRPKIIIRTNKTGEERELLPKLSSIRPGPRWSPDGRSFLVNGSDEMSRYGLYQVDAQTGALTCIVLWPSGSYIIQGLWASNGKAILYNHSGHIIFRELETGREKELFRLIEPRYGSRLAFSSDGRRLAFTEIDTATRSVVLKVRPTAGGEARDLLSIQESEEIYSIAWSPDGRYLLFTKERDPYITPPANQKAELWRIPVDGGEPQKLGLAMNGLTHLRVHPD